jgi:hypothetical protein
MTTRFLPTRRFAALVPDAAWRAALRHGLLVYLFSRICVFTGAALVAAELRADANLVENQLPDEPWADPHYIDKAIPRSATRPILDVLTSWDGLWYMRIIRNGYPRTVQPDVTYDVDDARAAFFPTYPGLVRVVDRVLPGGDVFAALVVNLVLGALAVVVVGVLAKRLFNVDVAEKSMVLMALFPGSFVLSFAYSEALLICLAGAALIALHQRQWWLAGVLSSIATATRPNGVALIAACAVASVLAIRDRREWRSLVAPILAPLGFIGFQLWLGWHANEQGVWLRVQTEAWGEGTSWGWTAVRRTARAIGSPLSSPTNMITAVSVATTILLIVLLWKRRLPWPTMAYCAVVIALMLLPATVTARPRFLYTAFPLLISAGAYFSVRARHLWPYVIGACTAGLVALTCLYGVLGAIP